jgi:hypothetical protein
MRAEPREEGDILVRVVRRMEHELEIPRELQRGRKRFHLSVLPVDISIAAV